MSIAEQPDAKPTPENESLGTSQWLSLKGASQFLGVHYTTLRNWSDKGEIRVFRTPGGHRRFSLPDLRRFLAERVGNAVVADSDAFVNIAVGRVREEIQRIPQKDLPWHYPLDDVARDVRRLRGRQLFTLAIAYILKPNQRPRLLAEGQKLGREYGKEAALTQIGLTETGRAVQFFRSQLAQVLRSSENPRILDSDDVRVRQLIDQFLDEVLYAVLDGYEEHLSPTVTESLSAPTTSD